MIVWTPKPWRPVSLEDVRLTIEGVSRKYNHALLHYDRSEAQLMIEQLREVGVSCEEFKFTASSVGDLATYLSQALRVRRITLPDDRELRKEILSVRLRETSANVLRIDHKSGRHDDRVIAAAMACFILNDKRVSGPVISTPADLARLKAIETATLSSGPLPVLQGGRPFGVVGSTAMPDSVQRLRVDESGEVDFDTEVPEERRAGTTKPSPFV